MSSLLSNCYDVFHPLLKVSCLSIHKGYWCSPHVYKAQSILFVLCVCVCVCARACMPIQWMCNKTKPCQSFHICSVACGHVAMLLSSPHHAYRRLQSYSHNFQTCIVIFHWYTQLWFSNIIPSKFHSCILTHNSFTHFVPYNHKWMYVKHMLHCNLDIYVVQWICSYNKQVSMLLQTHIIMDLHHTGVWLLSAHFFHIPSI